MRTTVDPSEVRRRRAAETLEEWAGPVTRRRSRNPKSSLVRARAEVAEMNATNDWSTATGKHFVALYEQLHTRIYGAPPAELEAVGFFGAVSSADKMLRDEFEGDPQRMIDFMRWVWVRERESEKRRAANGTDGRRLTWRLQFAGRHVLTDYRVALARKGKVR